MSRGPLFVPPFPPRNAGPVPAWRGLVGDRARNAVSGWSQRAFELPYIGRRVFGFRVHIPLDPELIQHVLLDEAASYEKPAPVRRLLAPTIGRGLLSSDGPLWREQRRIVAASFAPSAIDPLVGAFVAAAEASANGWPDEAVEDMALRATETTMRVIADTLFAGDPRLTSRQSMDHISAALEGVGDARLQVLLGLPLVPWSRRGWRARQGQLHLRRTLTALVDERIGGTGPDDFLRRLWQGLRERFDAGEARALAIDNAATFYLAGHETTANAIAWTLFLLSRQPDLQEQAAAEALAAGPLAGPERRIADRLPLLQRLLDESLRLYPPVPRFDRQAIRPDRIGDHEVRPGDIVSIWPWLLHRHRRLWDDPDGFDPDRFGPGARPRHRYQYIPFGAGPRMCVGARFAQAEALAIVATWLARFRFAPAGPALVRPSGLVTLRPEGGLRLRLTRR